MNITCESAPLLAIIGIRVLNERRRSGERWSHDDVHGLCESRRHGAARIGVPLVDRDPPLPPLTRTLSLSLSWPPVLALPVAATIAIWRAKSIAREDRA